MHKLTTFFLYAFVTDGLLSVVDAMVRQNTPGALPGSLALSFSFALLLLGFLLFVGMAFTPRLSKRLLLPPILFLGFSVVWGVLFGDHDQLTLSLAEIFLGLGLIVGFWQRSETQSGIQDFTSTRPFFTFKNFAFTVLLNGAFSTGMLFIIVLSLTQKVRGAFEDSTGRYVTIQPSGISLEEKTFQRGDKEIRLISMIHIAKSGFYDDVAQTLPATSTAVVLLEGVSDRKHRLQGSFDYSHLAQLLGFGSQKTSSFQKKASEGLKESRAIEAAGESPTKVQYQNADIDLAEFSPETIRWMQALGTMLKCSNFQEAYQKYSESKATFEQDPAGVFADILDKRNEHLLSEIQQAIPTHSVIVVPWGAQHMPGVQKQIEAWGFVETQRAQRQAIHFQNKTLISFLSLAERIPDDSR